MTDNNSIKSEAKRLMKTASPKPVSVATVFVMLAILFQFLTTNLTGVSQDVYDELSQDYVDYYNSGDYDKALESMEALMTEAMPTKFQSFAAILINTVQLIVKTGFIIFCVNTCRASGAAFGNLLDGFSLALKLIVITAIQIISVSFLSLLLIFPGVMIFYAYRGAVYILIDNPEKSAIQCLRESRQLMKGSKKKLFSLDLSFIGWFLLSLLPLFGYASQMYSLPYRELSYCLFFDNLRGISRSSYEAPEAAV